MSHIKFQNYALLEFNKKAVDNRNYCNQVILKLKLIEFYFMWLHFITLIGI